MMILWKRAVELARSCVPKKKMPQVVAETKTKQMNIFVSNLSFKASQSDVSDLFTKEGRVLSCNLVLDKETRKSRGFAFVEMPDDEAKKAIAKLNGTQFMGRDLVVKEALPRD